MDELSLYVLDITMNSVRAGADEILVELKEHDGWIDFRVSDNGCGMKEEQVKKLTDPFFTTRTTRKVGLGIPFLKMLAEMTGGFVQIKSVHESESASHGTEIMARFGKDHIDFIPLGDMVETVKTLIQGYPHINFVYKHSMPGGEVALSCAELREVLGEVSLNEPEVLSWIDGYLRDQYESIN